MSPKVPDTRPNSKHPNIYMKQRLYNPCITSSPLESLKTAKLIIQNFKHISLNPDPRIYNRIYGLITAISKRFLFANCPQSFKNPIMQLWHRFFTLTHNNFELYELLFARFLKGKLYKIEMWVFCPRIFWEEWTCSGSLKYPQHAWSPLFQDWT